MHGRARARIHRSVMNPTRVITYDGFTGTVEEWARRIPMNVSTLRSRLTHAMPIAKALTMPTQRPKYLTPSKVLEHQGERATINQWAQRVGLSASGLRYRLYRGRTLEEALTEPPHKMPARVQQRVAIKATSTAVKCFFCKRTASSLHFMDTGIFSGAPVCGASECVGTQRHRRANKQREHEEIA